MPSFSPIIIEGFAALISCTPQASDSMTASTCWLKLDDCFWLDLNNGSL